jgi:ABC-type dipeptide/oligopeptide/nickel transport system permease component
MVRFLVDALFQRDYPVVQHIHMLIAWCMLLGNLLVTVVYVSLKRHVRYQSVVGIIAPAVIARKGFL